MTFYVHAVSYSVCLFLGLMLFLKIGHMLGRKHRPRDKEGSGSALDGVVFAVLGLLLAFSFSASIDSFNAHRNLLDQEANTIAEANTWLALFPEEDRLILRHLLIQYVEARLIATEAQVNSPEELEAMDQGNALERAIWQQVVAVAQSSHNLLAPEDILGAFTRMIAAPGDQLALRRNHLPYVIYGLMFVLSLMSAMIAGYGMATVITIPFLRTLIFSLSVSASMYIIIDLEYPRSGLFQPAQSNLALREVMDTLQRDLLLAPEP